MGLWSNLSPEDEALAESCTPYGGEPVSDCTCHLLPKTDMDGCRYDGLCPSCDKAATEAGYDAACPCMSEIYAAQNRKR